MIKFKHALAVLTVCGLGFAQAVFADSGTKPCSDDIKRFCADVKPGGGRIMKCLKEHESDLSPACQEKGKEAHKRVEQVREACKDDASKLCKNVEPGEGRILKCLNSHDADLSQQCKEVLRHKQ